MYKNDNMKNRFFDNGELADKKIVSALKRAAKGYENGEIIETRDVLLEIVAAIHKWDEAEYGVAPYCPLCGERIRQ